MDTLEVTIPVRPAKVFLLPPPLFFVLAFGVGMLLNAAIPLEIADFAARVPTGIAMIGIGVLLGPVLAATFLARRTTLNPFGSPSLFMTKGVFGISRNPMYLGVVLIYLGGCVLALSLWPILFLSGPLALLGLIVIPYEEAYMQSRFGAAYVAYCARVRRWL